MNVDNWRELIFWIVELAFKEAGRAIFWMILGGLLGIAMSVAILIFGWRSTKRFGFFNKNKWGRWSMRAMLVLLGLSLIPLLTVNGGIYGLIVAADKTVVEQELVEKATQEAFEEALKEAISEIEQRTSEEGANQEPRYFDENEKLNLSLLREDINASEEMIYQFLKHRLLGEEGSIFQNAPEWFRSFAEKVTRGWFENSDFGELFSGVETVLDDAEQRKGVGEVTTGDLGWSIGKLYMLPSARQFGKDLRSTILVGLVGQVIVLVLGHVVVIGLILFVVRKMAGDSKDSREAIS